MHLSHSIYRRIGYLIVVVSISIPVRSSSVSATSLSSQSFPTQDNPKITITNATLVSITHWDKREVSISAEVMGAAATLQPEEVTIKSENNALEISCHPSQAGRRISITVQAPARAAFDLRVFGSAIQIRDTPPPTYRPSRMNMTGGNSSPVTQPAGPITIIGSREMIQLNVPESTALDMQETARAGARQQFGQGSVEIGVGGSRMGSGPPYVKVTALTTTRVLVMLGTIALPKKPLTVAAQTIARRGGSMGRALRQSSPQLIRPQRNQTAPATPSDVDEGALKLETHLINLNVSATDHAGRAVGGLKADDFTVLEDGVPQRISFFSPEQSPFNLVLLLDLSGSLRDEIELIKDTALHFLNVISPQDSVAVVTFTTDVTVVSQLTKDRDDLRDSIDFMIAPLGGTAFYDALGYVLVETLRKVKGQRNAVIAITDGEDNALLARLTEGLRAIGYGPSAGSYLTFEELLDGTTEADALIYPIHLDPALPQQANLRRPPGMPSMLDIQPGMTAIATKQLQSLADASGGRFYHANRIEDLKGVFEQVAAEMRSVYTMAYAPKNLSFDGGFRRIRVQLNRPDVVTRTRPGYYAR